METRLRNLLHDLATEMPVDAEGSRNRTLRRARGRRVLTAGAGVAVVVALVVVSVSVLRVVEPSAPEPAVTGPNPTPAFEGLWPETDPAALAVTQAAVDNGHMPLRTTAEGTATLFATNLLGWQLPDVGYRTTGSTGSLPQGRMTLELSDRTFGADVPGITVELAQLGQTGASGAWSVVGASSALIELDQVSEVTTGSVHISGRVSDLFDGAPALEAQIFDGPTPKPSFRSTHFELTDRIFALDVQLSPTPDGRATLLITMPDGTGASLGAVIVPVETPVGEAQPTGPSLTGVPPDVAVTAQRIYDAAKARDVDALAELVDPTTFDYNLEPGTDPIPTWRADPSQLDVMAKILEMAPTTREVGGEGTFTFWPIW